MAVTTKPAASPQRAPRRVWKVPTSKAWWLWLAFCVLLYGGIFAWYLYAIQTQPFPGPFNDPLRFFGIIAFVMVLGTAAYSLRRRFVRNLPGRAQDWLWMHMWVGITAILIALLHENFTHILHDYCQNLSCFTQAYAGTSALFALILLVVSGIIGRLLDVWQVPPVASGEQAYFQRAYETLAARARLVQSQQRQKRARFIIRTWRSIHMILASLALLVIIFHATMELLTNVLHLVKF